MNNANEVNHSLMWIPMLRMKSTTAMRTPRWKLQPASVCSNRLHNLDVVAAGRPLAQEGDQDSRGRGSRDTLDDRRGRSDVYELL